MRKATFATCAVVLALAGNLHAQLGAFFVGGTLSGLAPGDSVTLVNNGTDPVVLTSNGQFQFPQWLWSGAVYSVTVQTQPVSLSICTITNGGGIIAGANILSVDASCAAPNLQLTVTGSCPGPVLLAATNATPGGLVVFAYGTVGSYSVGGPTCNGLIVPLGAPSQLAAIIAGQTGYASFSGGAPAAACGVVLVTAVDVTICVATAAVPL